MCSGCGGPPRTIPPGAQHCSHICGLCGFDGKIAAAFLWELQRIQRIQPRSPVSWEWEGGRRMRTGTLALGRTSLRGASVPGPALRCVEASAPLHHPHLLPHPHGPFFNLPNMRSPRALPAGRPRCQTAFPGEPNLRPHVNMTCLHIHHFYS